jgi:alpha-amylase
MEGGMTEPIYFSLVFHNHQPVGQFPDLIEHSAHVSYLPLIETLERHPSIHVAIHYSGVLLEWLKQYQAPMMGRLREMVQRGQVELLSGGYYEPILAAIPDEDKIGQIEKLNEELRESFGRQPSGLWLAHRLWEPHLARPIAQTGLRYVILDDAHFEHVGYDKTRDLFGYYVTEEAGYTLAVFPALTHLRYAIPWEPVENVLDWLREQAQTEGDAAKPRLAMMADNGEKFGLFPGAFEHCWGDGKYVEELFSTLESNSEWLRTITPGQFLNQFRAVGRAYLAASSYQEMGVWSLPANESHQLTEIRRKLERERRQDLLRYMHGGLWRNFLVKYEEINHLHKRMLMVSERIHAMRRGRRRDRALEMLWAAQGNDPYWHGNGGGAYLFNLRVASYAALLAAEDAAENDEPTLTLARFDLDRDGQEDVAVLGQPLNAFWGPSYGGGLLELDYRPATYNLLNIMRRRHEGYHADLRNAAARNRIITPMSGGPGESEPPGSAYVRAKEPGLEKRLDYDWHRRASFLDHFLASSTTLDEFHHAQYAEQGDFVNQPYQIGPLYTDGITATVSLSREGHVWIGDIHRPVRIQKTFSLTFGDPTLHVHYTLTQQSDVPIDLRFGIETVVGFDGGQDLKYSSLRINGNGQRLPLNALREFEGVTRHSADTNLHNLTLITALSRPAFLWQFPLETITLSEGGFERGYQGTVFLHWWQFRLAPGETWEVKFTQTVQQAATRP